MSPAAPMPLNIQEIPQIVAKHRRLLIVGALLSGLLFFSASWIIPRKYKSHFVLTIYSKYFQSPLIGDFIPLLGESGESRSQRESLIRGALTPEFLDSLGEKYGIYVSTGADAASVSPIRRLRTALKFRLTALGLYNPPGAESRLSQEREDLLSRIDMYSVNPTTFNVSFSCSDPRVAYQVTQDMLNQIMESLLNTRTHILVTVRDAIEKRLRSVSESNFAPQDTKLVSRKSAAEELKVVQEQLRVLTATYTESHPLVQKLRDRETALERLLSSLPTDSKAGATLGSASGLAPESAMHDVSGDLVKKLNYLDIAIDSDQQHQNDYFVTLEKPSYPTSPSGPGQLMILAFGLAFGLFCSVFIAAIQEYFDRSAIRSGALAARLGVPVLGELPVIPSAAMSANFNGAPKREPSKTAGG